MILLTFAHKNEAQCFFEHFQFSPIQDQRNLWLEDTQQYGILITGEGQFESLNILSSLLAARKEITQIINLGVVGALNSRISNLQVLNIRTVYLSLENQPQFKSFPLQPAEQFSVCDCLTSSKRILDTETRRKLSPIADVVDRELWSLAFASSKAKIPLLSLKVVSDGEQNDTKSICEEVKEQAPIFSKILLNSFLAYINQENNNKDQLPSEDKIELLLNNKELYFTASMKRKLKHLISQTKLSGIDISNVEFDDIISQEISKKERSLKIINQLIRLLNPLRSNIEDKLNELSRPLIKTGWNIKYDSNIEEKWISISSKIQSPSQLHKLSQTLENFPLEEWQDIFDGHNNV
jgi:hypothetical protein